MTEQHLRDAHLKKALEHAPDANVQASAQVRNKVLGYAKNTVAEKATQPQNNWLVSVKNWLLKDHFANAQWAGLTGLAAVLLITVLLWREHPEDIVGIGDTPSVISESTEISQAPLEAKSDSAQKGVTPAPAETAQAELEQNQAAPAEVFIESQNIPTAPPVAEEKQVSRSKSTIFGQSAQQNNTQTKDENSAKKTETDKLSKLDAATPPQSSTLAKKEIAEDIALPEVTAPIESARTVAATPAPASLPTASDATLEAAPSKNKVITRGAAQAKAENVTEGSISTNSDADFSGGHQEEKRRLLARKSVIETNLAKTLVANGGLATAESDIKAGNYRLLKVIAHGETDAKADCVAPKTLSENIDEQTGLPIKNIDVCAASAQLLKEVESYNKTVTDWYLQTQRE